MRQIKPKALKTSNGKMMLISMCAVYNSKNVEISQKRVSKYINKYNL